jgi:hypothetical protein
VVATLIDHQFAQSDGSQRFLAGAIFTEERGTIGHFAINSEHTLAHLINLAH